MINKRDVPRYRNLCILFALLVTAALGYFTFNSFRDYVLAEERLEKEEVSLKALQDEIEQIRVSIRQYEEEQKEFEALLFDERDVPAFIDGLSSFANTAHVSIVDMKTQRFSRIDIPPEMMKAQSDFDKKKAQALKERKSELEETITLAAMPIKIRLQGEFEAIARFLVALEGYKQFVTINDVHIESRRDYPILSCSFTLRIYSLKTLEELK